MSPPRHAEALIRACLIDDRNFRDGILGDMTEAWSAHASARGASVADRWYWGQAMRSVPSLLALWCKMVGPRCVIAAVALAIVSRFLMLLVQYGAIAVVGVVTSDHRNVVASIGAAVACVGAAAFCGWTVRRIWGRDSGVTVGTLCIATLLVQVVSPQLTHGIMPAWLYWLSTGPLSAIAIIGGGARSGTRTT